MLIRRFVWSVLALVMTSVLLPRQLFAADPAGKDIVATAVEAGTFNTLATALKAAGLVETLQSKGPFTVFAPSDQAFGKLPAGTVETLLKPENKSQLAAILTYHVVASEVSASQVVKLNAAATVNGQRVAIKMEDGKVRIDQATVVKADIHCSNGIIHVIDQVILPSSDNIPATAAKAGTFNTLLAAAKAAGLVEALSGDQPLTVFAPTDAAFAKLPPGTVESLLKPENQEKLAAILKFHVVPGRVFSTDLLATKSAKSLQGGLLTASVMNGEAKVNGAGLLSTDIDAANGVIHVIDTVLLPPVASAKGANNLSPATSHRIGSVCPHSRPVMSKRVSTVQRR